MEVVVTLVSESLSESLPQIECSFPFGIHIGDISIKQPI